MGGRYFISHSGVDGVDLALRLADLLVAGPPSYPVWLDKRDLRAGPDYRRQIRDAIQDCAGLLFLMTMDAVQDNSSCTPEWTLALKCKKPVIPLLIDAGAEFPFELSSRQYIDFSDGFDRGLARLRVLLGGIGSPERVLMDLRDQLAEAERDLPRAGPARRPRIEQDIADLRQRVADQRRLLADPGAATRRTQQRIAAGMERQRRPERPDAGPARARFVNSPPVVAPGYFQDRYVESELAAAFLRADDLRIMTVVGRGGVGKSAMVCRLLKALEGGRLPDDLGELAVDGIVYLSPAGAHPVNFPNLFADLCRVLPAETAGELRLRYREPQQSPSALMRALLDAFPAGRVVVLLDNAEDVIDASSSAFAITDAALDEALRALLSAPAHGVKIIMTTRVAPRALLLVQPQRQRRLDLDDGLSSPYAEQVLRARDPDGRLGLRDAPDELLDRARQRTRGYPRALEALAAILAADRDATLPELLAEPVQLPENVVEALVGEAFSRLDAAAQQVMKALAIYAPTPVPPVAVDYLLQPYEPAVDAAPVLRRLVNMQFVHRDAGLYRLHQVDRDYALGRVPAGEPGDRDAGPAPFTQSALRHRGAEYFEQIRTPREAWKTLADLAPQFAEFDLRYAGGDYDTAAQVLLDIDHDYLSRWGHYRLSAGMHERLAGHLDDPWMDATSRNRLGSCWWSLGDIHRAIDLREQALAIFRASGDRLDEATVLNNLGLCHYDLGDIHRAVDFYEQALALYTEGGDLRAQAGTLGNLATSRSLIGQVPEALELCERALAIDREAGDLQGQAADLCLLGNARRDLGQPERAADAYRQAAATARQIGYRYGQAFSLAGLADVHRNLARWGQAIEYARQAADLADAISNAQAQSRIGCGLARIQLLTGDPAAALQTASSARGPDYLPGRAELSLMLGVARLRLGQPAAASPEFRDAISQADELLRLTSDAYAALDIRALALCGLALTAAAGRTAAAAAGRTAAAGSGAAAGAGGTAAGAGGTAAGGPGTAPAIAAFRAARAICSAEGIVSRVLALFDVIAAADDAGILAGIRPEAAGRRSEP